MEKKDYLVQFFWTLITNFYVHLGKSMCPSHIKNGYFSNIVKAFQLELDTQKKCMSQGVLV